MKIRWRHLTGVFLAAFLTASTCAVPVSAAGWHHSGNGWQYRYGQNSECARDCWRQIDGDWYRFDEKGIMRTGWILENNCWYYCNASGIMQTGWVQVGNSWYFCDQNGVMQTGILQIDGIRYEFAENGALIASNVPGYARAAYTGSGTSDILMDPVWDGTTVRITIPEGKNAAEIAKILEQNGICRREDFLRGINAYQTTSSTFDEWKGNSTLFYEYEGCLFPDTYEFYRCDDPETVIRRMLINCDNKLTEEWKEAVESKGLTFLEAVTLASLIQEEAAAPEDMAKVSAVFWNRLKNAKEYPKLQSNPTSEYRKNVILPDLQLGNIRIDPASYDTYQIDGLPAGPICNPGMDALWAAVNPDRNCHATFFCTDRNGDFYFAETYKEHLENVEIVNQINEKLNKS